MDKRKSFLKNSGFVEKIGLMVALFVIVVVFTVINKNYFSTQNLLNILTSASLTGLVAIGRDLSDHRGTDRPFARARSPPFPRLSRGFC